MSRFSRPSAFAALIAFFAITSSHCASKADGAASVSQPAPGAPHVTFLPYIQPGDAGPIGLTDQMVVAWQTDEQSPKGSAYTVTYRTGSQAALTAPAHGRMVDNYLNADPQFAASVAVPHGPDVGALPVYGPHTDYYALLPRLEYNTAYTYTVKGPGLPAGGFTATFHTRKTGGKFSFQVEGDEGAGDAQGRIIHTMYNIANIQIAGAPPLPASDFNLNAGDNVYGGGGGSDWDYSDHWMDIWNNDTDNLYGAPYIRSVPFYIAVGNHDVDGEGYKADLQTDSALACFNNFYDPLNGPEGVDIQYLWHGDQYKDPGMRISTYISRGVGPQPLAQAPADVIEALRVSTTVNTGKGEKRQIDHESNYSFDYGNAHVVVLEANPHLFDFEPNYTPSWKVAPKFDFPAYPSVLKNWLINDLDSSNAVWKFVIYHQPAFSSGASTLGDDNMRRVAKLLEDHGVNAVFSGHEHNYQRTLPLRVLPALNSVPTEPGPPAVAVDSKFDGDSDTVPDGVIYLIEGAGGAGLFDQRNGGNMIDQDDAASGNWSPPDTNLNLPEGPASWLDTNLTSTTMAAFVPAGGQGPKITVKFKSKILSFGDIVVNGNTLHLYQITEPLSDNPATPTDDNPVPYGTDYQGKPLNAPLPPTVTWDDKTGQQVKDMSVVNLYGQPVLLDKITITKPSVTGSLIGSLWGSPKLNSDGAAIFRVKVTNFTGFGLNGVQVVFHLGRGMRLATDTGATIHGQNAVVTIGRLDAGARAVASLTVQAPGNTTPKALRAVTAQVRSSTAQPVAATR